MKLSQRKFSEEFLETTYYHHHPLTPGLILSLLLIQFLTKKKSLNLFFF